VGAMKDFKDGFEAGRRDGQSGAVVPRQNNNNGGPFDFGDFGADSDFGGGFDFGPAPGYSAYPPPPDPYEQLRLAQLEAERAAQRVRELAARTNLLPPPPHYPPAPGYPPPYPPPQPYHPYYPPPQLYYPPPPPAVERVEWELERTVITRRGLFGRRSRREFVTYTETRYRR
jgi:hypothetical protein